MALKNAYSDISIDKTFTELQRTLAQHGAKQISFDYGDDGKVLGVIEEDDIVFIATIGFTLAFLLF